MSALASPFAVPVPAGVPTPILGGLDRRALGPGSAADNARNQSDVLSLGVVIFQMPSAASPFQRHA